MRRFMIGAALLVAGAAFGGGVALAQGGPPPPSSGTVIASGLSSTGAAIGPDGALYVGVGGSAETGDEEITVPADLAERFGIETVLFGDNSTVMRVDPDDGAVTTYADGLPSASDSVGGEPFISPTDVAWLGGELYVLISGGAPQVGGAAADWPNGIYTPDGEGWDLVADINQFNDDNPVDFSDAGPGGNPFALDVRGNEFIVSDGNYNRILRATTTGDISILASFDNVVPTGLATRSSGPVYNTWFSAFPHAPEDSHLVRVGYPGGAVTQVAGGYAQLIDVEFGADATYVLQFGDQSLDEEAPPPPGRLLRLGSDGSLTPVVTGLMLATSVNFSGDTAFVTSLTGDVTMIEGVSALQGIDEPEPEPTTAPPVASPTAPTGPITPPNTGMGSSSQGGMPIALMIALALAGLTLASAGGLVAVKHR